MWLLHTKTLELRHFIKPDRETPYAILSHVWEDIDHTHNFQDIRAIHARCVVSGEDPRTLVNEKVRNFCLLAEQDGYEWAWLDTCCIDKSSSAELSEAINSMYAWYMDSTICYTYLSDVKDDDNDPCSPLSDFRCSRWHSRGWTLQELIAPRFVVFLTRDWHFLGTKNTLLDVLVEVTKIPFDILYRCRDVSQTSVACRMSWAARRTTSRLEDRAYSLLGLFGVTMPIIYGEGNDAFMRLQMEILKLYTDHSIFAWGRIDTDFEEAYAELDQYRQSNARGPLEPADCWHNSLLASSPSQFALAGDIIPINDSYTAMFPTKVAMACTLTSEGILLTLPLSVDHTRLQYTWQGAETEFQFVYAAALACRRVQSPDSMIVLFLRGHRPTDEGGRTFGVGKILTEHLTTRGAKLLMKLTAPSDFTMTRLCLPSGIIPATQRPSSFRGEPPLDRTRRPTHGPCELFVPRWVLGRLKARHGFLLTHPTSGRGRMGDSGLPSGDAAYSNSVRFAFSNSRFNETIELHFGIDCECYSPWKPNSTRYWWLQVSFSDIPLTSDESTADCGRWHVPLPDLADIYEDEEHSVFNVDDGRAIHVYCTPFTPRTPLALTSIPIVLELVGFDTCYGPMEPPFSAVKTPRESAPTSPTAAVDTALVPVPAPDDPTHYDADSPSPSKWLLSVDTVADHIRRPLTGLRSLADWLGSKVDYTYGSLV